MSSFKLEIDQEISLEITLMIRKYKGWIKSIGNLIETVDYYMNQWFHWFNLSINIDHRKKVGR
jgi:hypothetical protein